MPTEQLSLMMSKIKTAFFCNNCGYESAKWLVNVLPANNGILFRKKFVQKDDRLGESGWKKSFR